MNSFQAKSVLITGGSKGLGRALARSLAERGARVVVVARNRRDLDETIESIGGARREVHGIVADVGEAGAPHRIAHEAAALVGPIDLLINNASTLGPTPLRLAFDLHRDDFERVLAVNLLGPFQLAQIAGGSMALRGGGTIVNISSDAAVEPYPRWSAYGASKAALDHLSAILAAELRDARVRVLAIDPGEMRTDMHREAIPDADPSTLADPSAVAEKIVAILESPLASGERIAAQSWSAA
jgi:NAD(P)-dependent dehydrogenase (short-subunit alcohol dehydrogenase family)